MTVIDIILFYRIPLHLFPVETQNKILEVVEEEDTPTPTTEDEEKYIDSSSFRESKSQPEVDDRSSVEISLRWNIDYWT